MIQRVGLFRAFDQGLASAQAIILLDSSPSCLRRIYIRVFYKEVLRRMTRILAVPCESSFCFWRRSS